MINSQGMNGYHNRNTQAGLWITIGVLVSVALFGLILAGALYLGLNRVKEAGPTPARFYLALKEQNYALAYSFLDGEAKLNNQPVDQQTFIKQAAQADAQNSVINGFDYTENGDKSKAVVKVHRGGEIYQARLTLKQVGDRWVIASIDRL